MVVVVGPGFTCVTGEFPVATVVDFWTVVCGAEPVVFVTWFWLPAGEPSKPGNPSPKRIKATTTIVPTTVTFRI